MSFVVLCAAGQTRREEADPASDCLARAPRPQRNPTAARPGGAAPLWAVLFTEEGVGVLLFSQQWLREDGRSDLGNKRVKSPEKRRDPQDGR